MKILYISVFRDGSGYAHAATQTLLALDEVGAQVAARCVRWGDCQDPLPRRLLELEERSFPRYDVVIQHVPPYAFDYDGRIPLNVGIFYTETRPLTTGWANRAAQMDLLLVPSQSILETLAGQVGRAKTELLPIPCDLERYQVDYAAPALPEVSTYGQDGNRFLFYTVGELAKRKNLVGLLRAFHGEFRPWEQVGLVIKCSSMGKSAEETLAEAQHFILETKKGLMLYPTLEHYLPELVLPSRLDDRELLALHRQCDCFIQPSFGEAWSLPALDALALGKTPVVPNSGGYREYVTPETGYLIATRPEPVFGEGNVHAELFTGRHIWDAPDLLGLMEAMRAAYQDSRPRSLKEQLGLAQAGQFSRRRIGQRLLEILCHHRHEQEQASSGRVPGLGSRPS